jgi:hypothetical protein
VPLTRRQPCQLSDLVLSGRRYPGTGAFEADQVDLDTWAAICAVLDPDSFAQARRIHGHTGFLAHFPGRGLRVALSRLRYAAGEEEDITPVRPDTEDPIAPAIQPDRGDHYRCLRCVHLARHFTFTCTRLAWRF